MKRKIRKVSLVLVLCMTLCFGGLLTSSAETINKEIEGKTVRMGTVVNRVAGNGYTQLIDANGTVSSLLYLHTRSEVYTDTAVSTNFAFSSCKDTNGEEVIQGLTNHTVQYAGTKSEWSTWHYNVYWLQ